MTHFTLGDFTDPYGYTQKRWARQTLLYHASGIPGVVQTLWDAVSPLLDNLPPPIWLARRPDVEDAAKRAAFTEAVADWQRPMNVGPDAADLQQKRREWWAPAAEATAHWWAEERRAGRIKDELVEPYRRLIDP